MGQASSQSPQPHAAHTFSASASWGAGWYELLLDLTTVHAGLWAEYHLGWSILSLPRKQQVFF